ncbi:MAG: hypothetical protein ACI9BD_000302 [Candidatus Marinamargulisbacteria bacterium]|jgi:hypothetical protein
MFHFSSNDFPEFFPFSQERNVVKKTVVKLKDFFFTPDKSIVFAQEKEEELKLFRIRYS